MEDNNYTVYAAIATAFAAIVAPTISSIIQSITEYKLNKLNHTIESRLTYYNKFSTAYSQCQYGKEKCGYALDFYNKAMDLILLCKRRHTRRLLFALANTVKTHGASIETDKMYEKCVRLLSKEF